VLAPLAAAASFLRQARIFHPDGVVYRAEVTADAQTGPARDVAARLAGPALVRLSPAIRRRRDSTPARRANLLGVAIRFNGGSDASVGADESDQDLLFATARSPLSSLVAPFTTDVDSFLNNDYYAIARFHAGELGAVTLRLETPRIAGGEVSREEALEQAAKAGMAVLELQARPARSGSQFMPVARIRLIERVNVDQAALRFSPFRTGRGIEPRGFLNALRIVPYAASQLARPRR
jgi:hypothetical protein